MEHGAEQASLGVDINAIPEEGLEAKISREDPEATVEEVKEQSDNLLNASDLVDEGFSQGMKKDTFAGLEDFPYLSIENLHSAECRRL